MRNPLQSYIGFSLLIASIQGFGMGKSPSGYTLLVAPDTPYTLKISHDVSDHYPVLLVSYEVPGDPAAPFLHVLHDGRWIRVPADQFKSGSFLQQRPSRTIVVGDDNQMTESLITSVQSWSAQVINHPAGNNTELLNAYGQDFQFSKRTWRWFAGEYGLTLEDRNGESNVKSWYDQPYIDERKENRPPASLQRIAPPQAAVPAPAPQTLPTIPETAPAADPIPVIKNLDPVAAPEGPQFKGWQEKTDDAAK